MNQLPISDPAALLASMNRQPLIQHMALRTLVVRMSSLDNVLWEMLHIPIENDPSNPMWIIQATAMWPPTQVRPKDFIMPSVTLGTINLDQLNGLMGDLTRPFDPAYDKDRDLEDPYIPAVVYDPKSMSILEIKKNEPIQGSMRRGWFPYLHKRNMEAYRMVLRPGPSNLEVMKNNPETLNHPNGDLDLSAKPYGSVLMSIYWNSPTAYSAWKATSVGGRNRSVFSSRMCTRWAEALGMLRLERLLDT